MSVIGIDWTAIKLESESLDEAKSFGDALGLLVVFESETQMMLQTENGGILEFCSSKYVGPEHLFKSDACVIGFKVEDLEETSLKLIASGFEPVIDITDGGPVRYRHFVGPDQRSYSFIQHK